MDQDIRWTGTNVGLVQTSDNTNVGQYNVGQYKRQTITNVGLRKINYLNLKIFLIKTY